jgi:hypothetical protein
MNPGPANRFRPNLEELEDRSLPSVSVAFTQADGTLTLHCDSRFNRIFLGNDGAGHITGFVDGTGALNGGPGFFDAAYVTISGDGGRYQVDYGQLGDQIRPFGLFVNSGVTTDFTADMGGHAIRSALGLTALGGPGHNTFSVNAAGVNLLGGGFFSLWLGSGAGGDNAVSVNYSGVKSKFARLEVFAFAGKGSGNSISVTGTVRSDPFEAGLPAGLRDTSFLIDGGDTRATGRVNRYRMVLDSDLPLSNSGLSNSSGLPPEIFGGPGVNNAFASPNVLVLNCRLVPSVVLDASSNITPASHRVSGVFGK